MYKRILKHFGTFGSIRGDMMEMERRADDIKMSPIFTDCDSE
jgi:hypothetical protein